MNTRRQRVLAELRMKIRTHEHDQPKDCETISTGSEALNRLLPDQGIRPGSLVEWVGLGEASGAGTLSLWVIQQFSKTRRPAIVVDSHKLVYPVALQQLGSDPAALILVRPGNQAENLWAIEQALRCEAVSVVWGRTDQLTPVTYRRFKLAAEHAGSLGFFIRSAQALSQPTWADVRLVVEPRPSWGESPCFRVRLAYSRGQTVQQSVNVQIDGDSGQILGVSHADEKTPFVSLVS
jgi:protein ImuA